MTHIKTFANRTVEILLVEDNPGDVDLARETMEESIIPISLVVAKDGVEAMNYLNKVGLAGDRMPDLVLLDLNLPKMDGRAVLEAMRANELLLLLPVIVLTSSDAEQDIAESYKKGANCYVKKPGDINHFRNVIRQIEEFWFTIVKLPPENYPPFELGGTVG
ncbi:MAG: response regulator [Armatimonadetes bacterium]|nr:response regulator [Armatimonadota bacterium]